MKRAGLIGGIVALIVVFFAVNMIATALVRNARLDLTEGRVFTLTQGSRNIAGAIEEPVSLTFYYSAKVSQGQPQVQQYARRVRELLEEYARISGGKIRVSVVDPEPNSEEEDAALAEGVTGVPVGPGRSLYLGLVGKNSTDEREVIPFLDMGKERFLEYDVTRLVYALAHPKKKVVGLVTGLPMSGGFTFDQRTRQPVRTPSWQIAEQIRGTFELRNLAGSLKEVPKDVDVLMVAHPRNLTEETLFAIDQFVLRGGRLIAFVDPFCEADESAGQDPTARFSEFSKLLDAWGVEVVRGKIAADKSLAKVVMFGSQQRPERVTYVAWIGADGGHMSKEDPITGQLQSVNFASAGFIRSRADAAPAEGQPAPGAKPKAAVAPLAWTSEGAWEMPVMELAMPTGPDPKAMLEHYQAGKEPLTLAARLSGKVGTAFPGGVPSAEAGKPAIPAGLQEGEINVVLVADADMLADNQWIRVQNFFGQALGQKLADNADFVVNALENLCGSSDLIGVRARPSEQRPFVLVQEMQKRAEEKYAAEQKALNLTLQDTVRKLEEMQARRGADEKSLVLTPEQQKVLEDLKVEYADTRKKLRRVEHGLSQDIETLGMKLRLINTALIPALVTVGAVGLAGVRAARRRRGKK